MVVPLTEMDDKLHSRRGKVTVREVEMLSKLLVMQIWISGKLSDLETQTWEILAYR